VCVAVPVGDTGGDPVAVDVAPGVPVGAERSDTHRRSSHLNPSAQLAVSTQRRPSTLNPPSHTPETHRSEQHSNFPAHAIPLGLHRHRRATHHPVQHSSCISQRLAIPDRSPQGPPGRGACRRPPRRPPSRGRSSFRPLLRDPEASAAAGSSSDRSCATTPPITSAASVDITVRRLSHVRCTHTCHGNGSRWNLKTTPLSPAL